MADTRGNGLEQSSGTGNHWTQAARLWRELGPPLRPCAEDTDILERMVKNRVRKHGPPRVLILGVTPEIHGLAWPSGTDIKAVDHNTAMIRAIWPGDRGDVIRAEWTNLPFRPGSRDIALCDGGFQLLGHPVEQRAFIACLQRTLCPDGLVSLRAFTPPANGNETADDVLDDLMQGGIPNLNALKIRLWGALQDIPQEGVALTEVWNTLSDRAPDLTTLADHLGWSVDHLLALKTYQHSQQRYHLLSADAICEMFCSGGFQCIDRYTPTYPLGERCPTLVFRRL